MTKRKKQRSGNRSSTPSAQGGGAGPRSVASLLDVMEDGNEYGSIVSLVPRNTDIVVEIRRAIQELQAARARPCVLYVANQIKDVKDTAIQPADHLPFCEMVGRIA